MRCRRLSDAVLHDHAGGALSFYVERPAGHRVAVIIGRSAAGHEYIKTESDGEQPNNLLALPACLRQ